MTEREWLTGSHAGKMLIFLDMRGAPERKLRLFALACCWRVRHLLADVRLVRALCGLGAHADGRLGPEEHRTLTISARQAVAELESPLYDDDGILWPNDLSSAARAVLCALGRDDLGGPGSGDGPAVSSVCFHVQEALGWLSTADSARREVAAADEERAHVELLRDIIGNPFRPVTFSPAWRTDTAVSLARTMYGACDFSPMPILTDALQDAGCDSADILEHGRGSGPHVRGCWVVDLVLDKG